MHGLGGLKINKILQVKETDISYKAILFTILYSLEISTENLQSLDLYTYMIFK